MIINRLATLSLFGLAFIYSAKLIDTLYPGIFGPVGVAATVVGMNILAGLVQLLFFIVLYRQFVPKDKPVLRFAAGVAVIGSVLGMLPKLLAMALVLQQPSLIVFIRRGTLISAFCPWLSAVFLFAFSLVFFHHAGFRHAIPLKRAFAAGAAGWFIMAAAQTLVLINFLTSGRLVWLADLFTAGPIVFATVSSLTFLGLSVFYLTFAHRSFTGP